MKIDKDNVLFKQEVGEISRTKIFFAKSEDPVVPVSFRFLLNILNNDYSYIEHQINDKKNIIEHNNIKLFNNNNVRNIDTPVVLLDFIPSYSHFLIDIIGKFLYINKYFPEARPVFIISEDENSETYKKSTQAFKDVLSIFEKKFPILEIINVKDNNGFIFNKVYSISSDNTQESQKFYRDEKTFIKLREMFKPNRKPLNNRNMFISRSQIFDQRGGDTSKLESIFIKNNYEILFFENMTFDEQVSAFYDAKNIVAVEGTSLVNLLFANKGLKVLSFNCDPEFSTSEWGLISKHFEINYSNIYTEPKNISYIFNIFNEIKETGQ